MVSTMLAYAVSETITAFSPSRRWMSVVSWSLTTRSMTALNELRASVKLITSKALPFFTCAVCCTGNRVFEGFNNK